ncbi:MAG: helix-turn-helix domain-containing protein [bacterium]
MLNNQLQQLGFGKNEIKIYLALFELGKCRAGEIIDNTKLHRNIVYQDLEDLVKRDLVTKTEVKGVFEYSVNNPESLVEEFEIKKQLSRRIADQLVNRQKQSSREVSVYEGMDGLKKSRNKMLKYSSKDELFVFAVESISKMEKYWRSFHKKRDAKGIKMRMLYERKAKKQDVDWRDHLENSQAKYLPFSQGLPIWFAGIGEHLELGIPGENPLTFNIRSKEAVDGFKTFFDYFWNQEVVVENGFDALRKVFYEMIEELEAGEEYCVLGTSLPIDKKYDDFFDEFHVLRIKKGIVLRMLAYKEFYQRQLDRLKRCGDKEGEISFIKLFTSSSAVPMQITLYKNKARIIIFGEMPVVMYINQKEIYQGFKQQFEDLWSQKVIVERGLEPLKRTIYEMLDELAPGDEYCVLGASSGDYHSDVQKLYDKFHADRVKKGVITKMLVYKESFEQIKNRFEKCGDKDGAISILKQYASAPLIPMQVNMYNNKVFFVFYGQSPTVWKFDGREIHDGLKTYFNDLWNQDTQVLRGPEIVKQIWMESLECGELRFIGARGYFIDHYPDMFAEIEKKAGAVKGLKWKNVVDGEAKNHKLNKLPWMEAKYNTLGSKNPNVVWLWGQKVAIVNWTEKEPVIFISSNKHLVQSYNDYFGELWGVD